MADKKFVKGFRTFPKKDNQPDFVIGDLVIDIADFKEFINSNTNLLTEYNNKKQLKCQILKTRDGGISISVNDFKPQQQAKTHPVMQGPATMLEDDGVDRLPF